MIWIWRYITTTTGYICNERNKHVAVHGCFSTVLDLECWIWSSLFFPHKIQLTIEQDSYTKANESGEEAQKETMGLVDIGLPESKI